MKILLINPPNYSSQRLSRDLMGGFGLYVNKDLVYPPMVLASIAAVLLQKDFQIKILDAGLDFLTDDDVLKIVKDEQVDLIGIQTSKDAFQNEINFSNQIKKVTDAKVCLLGPMANEEGIFLDLKAAASQDVDLNTLPFPARFLLKNEKYFAPGFKGPVATMITSRGCPLNCDFCGYVFSQGNKFLLRSYENIIAEIKEIVSKFSIANIVFRDPIFSYDMKRVKELCELIIKEKLSFSWMCETAPVFLNEELIQSMARAGCIGISLGVETGNDGLQKNYARNKIKSKSHLKEIAQVCRNNNIKTRLFFMAGFPGETEKMFDETIQLAVDVDPDTVQFLSMTRFPGTRWENETNDAEINRWIKKAYRTFYFRPEKIQTELRDPLGLIRKIKTYIFIGKQDK